MFEYGQIIEYVDATYDENFNAAYAWCQANSATLDEIIDKRKSVEVEYTELEMTEDGEVEKNKTRNELHRFFQINAIKPEPQLEPEPRPEPTQEEIADQRRYERDMMINSYIWRVQRYEQQTKLGLETTDTEEDYLELLNYIQYLRDLPESPDFPDVDVLSFEDWKK